MIFSPTEGYPDVFTDWLDVTQHPEENRIPQILDVLEQAGAMQISDESYRVGNGTASITKRQAFARISLSGGVLATLRGAGLILDALHELGSIPHRVTRLDAAMDLPLSMADYMPSLDALYPQGTYRLTRKAAPVRKYLSIQHDGRPTGTVYIGNRRNDVSAKFYDKTLEMLERRKVVIPQTLRIEFTVRSTYKGSGPSLDDAFDPTPLFFDVMPSEIMPGHADVPEWSPGNLSAWISDARSSRTPYERLKRKFDEALILDTLIDDAIGLGPHGPKLLRRWIEDRISKRVKAGPGL